MHVWGLDIVTWASPDFFQYSWASSLFCFNTLNKNTTVKRKTSHEAAERSVICTLLQRKTCVSFPHRRKELCLLVKKVFDESHRQLSEERRRCCRWNPTPAGWSRTIWTLGDWAEGWWSVSDPIICTVHTHTHTQENVFTMVFNWAVQQFGWSLFILRPSAGLLKVFTLFRDSAGATVKEEWVFGSEEHRQNHL